MDWSERERVESWAHHFGKLHTRAKGMSALAIGCTALERRIKERQTETVHALMELYNPARKTFQKHNKNFIRTRSCSFLVPKKIPNTFFGLEKHLKKKILSRTFVSFFFFYICRETFNCLNLCIVLDFWLRTLSLIP